MTDPDIPAGTSASADIDTDTDTDGTDSAVTNTIEIEPTASAAPVDRPRIRWAGIVWGLAFAGTAIAALVFTRSPDAYRALVEWVAAPSLPELVAAALLIAGAAILIAGVAGMLRRGQRLRASRRASRTPAPAPEKTVERHTA